MKPVWWSAAAGFFSGVAVSASVVVLLLPEAVAPQSAPNAANDRVAQVAHELARVKARRELHNAEDRKLLEQMLKLEQELGELTGNPVPRDSF